MNLADTNKFFLLALTDGVLTLSFNRPEQRNAMPTEAMALLEQTFKEAAASAEVRVLLVRGEGDHFGGGGDVTGMQRSLSKTAAERREEYFGRLDRVRGMIEAYCTLEMPIVAACRGAVAGAAMMYTLGADLVFADDSVYFLCAHQQVGLTPDGGVSYLLPRVVGVKKAAELILTARPVEAAEALQIGLVSKLLAADDLDDSARKAAMRLARAPQRVVRRAKKLIRASLDHDLETQLIRERDCIVECVQEPDFEEGVSAFLEKRRPAFSSRS